MTFFKDTNGKYVIPQKYLRYDYMAELLADDKYRSPNQDAMPGWMVYGQDSFEGLKSQNLLQGHQILLYYPGKNCLLGWAIFWKFDRRLSGTFPVLSTPRGLNIV